MKNHEDYLKAAINEIENKIKSQGQHLPKSCNVTMCQSQHPQLDASDELEGEDVTYYQEVIEILR